jgi:hypothetical protein
MIAVDLTGLYRLFANDGALLYIGISNNVNRRLTEHSEDKAWWSEVDRSKTHVTWYDSREQAEIAELAAVRDEAPRYNTVTVDGNGRVCCRPAPPGRAWGRPRWLAANDEQRRLLAAAERAAHRADRLAAQAKAADEEAWQAILAARTDVPDLVLCERTHRSRATLNRRYGARTAIRWTGDNFDEIKELRPDARLTVDGDLEIERVDEPGTWVVVGRNYVVHRRESVE